MKIKNKKNVEVFQSVYDSRNFLYDRFKMHEAIQKEGR